MQPLYTGVSAKLEFVQGTGVFKSGQVTSGSGFTGLIGHARRSF